jgi:hypothetical protein
LLGYVVSAALYAALAELVACKDLKDGIEAAERAIIVSPACAIDYRKDAELRGMRMDYERRKPAAWEAARAALRQPITSEAVGRPSPLAVFDAKKAQERMREARMASGEFTKAMNSLTMGIASVAADGGNRLSWFSRAYGGEPAPRMLIHEADSITVSMVCDELLRRGFIIGMPAAGKSVTVSW